MHSLCSYDLGRLAGEGAKYTADIQAGNQALERLEHPILMYNASRALHKKKQYKPRRIFCVGNHENRINKHVQAHPNLEGKLTIWDLTALDKYNWEIYNFLEIVEVNGVYFSHYFVNPDSAKSMPFSSNIDFQLKSLGHSFIYGHQQGLKIAAPRYTTDGRVIRGTIAGSFYQHDEEYRGPQGNDHWRGALYLEDVKDGMFRQHELPLDWLMRNYL